MKKIFFSVFIACTAAVLLNTTAFASATIDTSRVSQGIVIINLTDAAQKTIKAQVEKGTEKYVYSLIKSTVNLPLQMGTGDYKITVLENIGGNKYKPLSSTAFSVSSIDEKAMYIASIPMAEYSISTKAIPVFQKIADGKSSPDAKLTPIYKEIISNYKYDFDKAASVKGDYVPVLDDIYTIKKGICYDYSSLLCGALRSIGIPTKVIMGYAPEISGYHAWNEILISGEWVVVDSTYDAQIVSAGLNYNMKKDKSKFRVVKTY